MPGFYEIFVRGAFCAAHCLKGHGGPCARIHGHNWQVEARLRCVELDQCGMAVDFVVVDDALNRILADLDHRDLTQHPAFQTQPPTAEVIAQHVFTALAQTIDDDRVHISEVTVWETSRYGACYRRR